MTPMMISALIALSIPQPRFNVWGTAEATATIRVLQGATLKLDGSPNPDAPPPCARIITASDGSLQHVEVIDFQ